MPLRKVLIIGAGGFGREVLASLLRSPECGQSWAIGGFLDDDVKGAAERLRSTGVEVPVIGSAVDHVPGGEYLYICAIGDPRTKLRISERLAGQGAEFINLVDPTAQIGPRCRMGVGNILMHYAGLTTDVQLGNFVSLNRFVSVGHDAVVGDGCTLSSYCDVTGYVRLARGVFMGSHATVLPGAVVEEFCTVGAGSVVVRHASAGKTVLGVPARVLNLRK